MIQRINFFLEKKFHFKFIRSRPIPDIESNKNTLIIEFMGPSAVGKTTLCNYFIKNHKSPLINNFLTSRDLIPYGNNKVKLTGIHEVLFSERINTLSKNATGNSKFIKISNFYYHLKNDFIINNYFSNKVFILDEHLIHSFYQLPDILVKLHPTDFLKNRVFINCSISVEALTHNVRKRIKQGTAAPGYKDLTDEEIWESAKKRLKNKNKSAQTLQDMGASVLTLNMENELNKNLILIDNFLEDYLSNSI